MLIDVKKNILIVGLGLIGGSYAKALRRFGFTICAISRSQSTINYALENGLIDEGSVSAEPEMIGRADIVIFGLYPHVLVEWIEQYQQYFKPGAWLTDVTGVKRSVVYRIQEMLRPDVEFIAAHPMAGKEVAGVENSSERIFIGANYIVVPTEKNTQDVIASCIELGQLLGFAQVSCLSPEQHDEMIAFVSQLTHCIAISLMTCNDQENMEKYTGDSFRDLTRIARIQDEMWSELFLLNKDALLRQMDLFQAEFLRLRTMLAEDDRDGMREMMRKSTQRRALFDKK